MSKNTKIKDGFNILVRLSDDLNARLKKEWHRRELSSRSETIRVLLEEALGAEGR